MPMNFTSCRRIRLLSPQRGFHSAATLSNALKVAFFGSDKFSIVALRHILEAQKEHSSLIKSIDLIAKHPKPTGRDHKTVTDVPIAEFARGNGINVIRAESNAEINDLISRHYDMAIAVSYGKLIPKKFLSTVPFSLNVHPSLLPKYSGASPLQFALLNNDAHTGITLQTLHPTEFDKGEIVAQTPEIDIKEGETLTTLRDRLAEEGAKLLVSAIKDGSYKHPQFVSKYSYSYASKITPQMSEVDWSKSAHQITRQYNTLGNLYTYKEVIIKKRRKPLIHEWRRVILSEITKLQEDVTDLQPGEFKLVEDALVIQTSQGAIATKKLQLEFEKTETAPKFMTSLPKRAGDTPNIFTTKH